MRIISGKYKGKKILLPEDKLTRPLRDLVKESIFNILQHSNSCSQKIERSNVLDLFSGSGSFGLECISRGAKKVTFFENYEKALKILNKNIINLKCFYKTEIFKKNVFNSELKNIGKFDLIFIDPPFKNKEVGNLISKILNLKILKKDGLIILHRHKNDKDILPENFRIIIIKKYGISKIFFGN